MAYSRPLSDMTPEMELSSRGCTEQQAETNRRDSREKTIVSAMDFWMEPYESSISGVISDKGLEYAKELLIEKCIASIVMLQLPEIENSVQVHLVGN